MRPDDLTPARDRKDDLESQLRSALDHRAQGVGPQYRLDAILDQARSAPQRGLGTPARWTLGLVAAALVLALAIVVPGLIGGSSGEDPALPATTPTPTESAPTEEPTASPTATATGEPTTATPTGTGTADATLAALPVYHPAHIGDDLHSIRLFREWVNIDGVLRGDPVDERLAAAIRAALTGYAPHTDGYLNYWQGVDLVSATSTPQRITLRLSGPGAQDIGEEEARISVQQLVWTAQGTVGAGTIPVRFEIESGAGPLLGHVPTNRDFNRPASSDLYYEDLAPIWITSPTREQVISGADVVVTGEATLFEGTFQWELIDDTGAVLRSDHGQASAGGPARATFEIRLGRLDPSHYAIRVYALSMKDGTTVQAEQSIGFTVR